MTGSGDPICLWGFVGQRELERTALRNGTPDDVPARVAESAGHDRLVRVGPDT